MCTITKRGNLKLQRYNGVRHSKFIILSHKNIMTNTTGSLVNRVTGPNSNGFIRTLDSGMIVPRLP